MGRPYKCPACGSGSSVSKGVRRTKTMGERRIRRCKACGRKFTPRHQTPTTDTKEPIALPAELANEEPQIIDDP